LRSGIISAHKFELDAWDSNEGLYLNSKPIIDNADKNYYLKIGNNTNYIKFGGGGALDICVTDFSLTYKFGDNLLFNTTPLETGGDNGVAGWAGTNSDNDSVPLYGYLDPSNNDKKSIFMPSGNQISQELINILSPGNYTFSGWFRIINIYSYVFVNTDTITKQRYDSIIKMVNKDGEIVNKENYFTPSGDSYTGTNLRGCKYYYKVGITLQLGNDTKDYSFENTNDDYVEIKQTFKISSDTSDFSITLSEDIGILLYHLKLERGLNATPWCQSPEEKAYAD
jgi:hypothetical protein